MNREGGGVLMLVFLTLALCACVTMALAVFMMREKNAHYTRLVPRLMQMYEEMKKENESLGAEHRKAIEGLARAEHLLAAEKATNELLRAELKQAQGKPAGGEMTGEKSQEKKD